MAKKKNRWSRGKTGLKEAKVPPMSKVVKDKRAEELKAAGKKGSLTMEEKIGILEMYQSGQTDTSLIGQKFNRSPEAIRKFLWRYADTTKLARARLVGGAEQLADRIVEQANVDQALEVMDRLDILARKRDKSAPVSSFQLIIGVDARDKTSKGGLPPVPVPTQRQIEDAIEAEVVKTVG